MIQFTHGKREPEKTGRIKASPLAKSLAAEHGIALSGITGSHSTGRITADDVRKAIAAAAKAPAAAAKAAPGAQPAQAGAASPAVAGAVPYISAFAVPPRTPTEGPVEKIAL